MRRNGQEENNVGERVITRLYTVNPKNIELFYLRLLLLHTRGATSHADLRAHKGDTYTTYHDTCVARGLTESDHQWRMALEEAAGSKTAAQISRNLTKGRMSILSNITERVFFTFQNPSNSFIFPRGVRL